jgi:hypothetical protein
MVPCRISDERRFDTMADLKRLKREVLTDLGIEKEEADVGVEPLFFAALKDTVLEDGIIDAKDTTWLRQMLFADGKIDDRRKAFLRELLAEARVVCPEFRALCNKCLRK